MDAEAQTEQQQSDQANAAAPHPADPSLALMMQLQRISFALGNVRCQLAGLELPPEVRSSVADDQSNILEILQSADQELAGFAMNLRDDLVGTSLLSTPTRRRVHLPPRERIKALRQDYFDLVNDARTLNADAFDAHDAEYMDAIRHLETAGVALAELEESIEADDDDDDDSESEVPE